LPGSIVPAAATPAACACPRSIPMAISAPITKTSTSPGWVAVSRLRLALLAGLLAASGCAGTTVPKPSPAATMAEAGMVDIRMLVPDMSQEIHYAGSDNFVGAPVDGYEAPRCWLRREAAEALARVEASLRSRDMRLHVYDCYRPVRAVAHFMRWVNDPGDIATKATHYPELEKAQLLDGYIAEVSGHSRGHTVDLTLMR